LDRGRTATVPLNVIILLVVVLVIDVFAPRRLTGQVTVEVAAGARYSTALVRDSIVTRFDVGPALAPTVAVTLATPLERGWGAQATLDFSTSGLRRHDADGSSVAFGRVSAAAFIVGLERRLPTGFAARIGVGGLKYLPGGKSGIFRLGSGPIAGLGTVSLGYPLPLGARYGLAVEARYDVHGFATPALREEGFGGARTVHRVTLTIRAGRGGR
jgi:hypothetical protein